MSSSPRRIDIKSKPYRRFVRGTGAALVIYPLLAWGIHYMLFGKILVNPAKLWVPILAMIMVGLFARGLFALAMPTAYARFFRLPRTNQPDMLIALLRFIASGLLMAFAISAYHIPYNEPLLIAWQAFVVLALLSQVKHMGLLNKGCLYISSKTRYVLCGLLVLFLYLASEMIAHPSRYDNDDEIYQSPLLRELHGHA